MTEQLTSISLKDRFPALKEIPSDKFPRHVFIIADGNGRWAKGRRLSVTEGHAAGARAIEKILDDLAELPEVPIISVWGFSADNWKRDTAEVGGLMDIFGQTLGRTIGKIIGRRAQFIHLGRKDRLPDALRVVLTKAEQLTDHNTGKIFAVAIDFGGEDQELRIIEKARELPSDIPTTPEVVVRLRDGGGRIPPADLIIRTAGERRTSDVGWINGSQTELYVTEKFFPDIKTADIVDALIDFSKRDRRFGGRKK